MKSRFKNVGRARLRSKLHKRCKCSGIIKRSTQVWGSFGVNDANNKRVLLSNVFVENILINHVWVKSRELNNKSKYMQGAIISFEAYINSYQKINGSIGIGLFYLNQISLSPKINDIEVILN